jgi:hypothetical protein
MAEAPRLTLYEVKTDEPSRKVGDVFTPDQFYALATAISCVEPRMLIQDDPDFVKLTQIYKGFDKPRKAYLPLFEQYCATCANLGKWASRPDWAAQGSDFSERARCLMVEAFFDDGPVSKTAAPLLYALFIYLDKLIEAEMDEWDGPKPIRPKHAKRGSLPILPRLPPIRVAPHSFYVPRRVPKGP